LSSIDNRSIFFIQTTTSLIVYFAWFWMDPQCHFSVIYYMILSVSSELLCYYSLNIQSIVVDED